MIDSARGTRGGVNGAGLPAPEGTGTSPANGGPAVNVRRHAPLALGLVLALATFISAVRAQHDVGIARDETVYMHHSARYADWWLGLFTGDSGASDASITKTWGGKAATDNNREHPPLIKTLMGLSEKLFHDKLGLVDEATGFRLPTAALHALLVFLVFAFARRVWGTTEGVVAGLLTWLMPRAFFHAQLACFDAPIACLWFATVYAYYRALEARRWVWGAGVVLGLALATKHNAMLLPAALGLHALWVARHDARVEFGDGGWPAAMKARLRELLALPKWRLVVLVLVAPLSVLAVVFYLLLGRRRVALVPALALLAPLTLYALWPWLWHAPIDRVGAWLSFHLTHVNYNFEYLGANLNTPPFPWHVALVTTAVTAPVVTLVGALVGVGLCVVRARRGTGASPGTAPALLLGLSAAVAMGPFFLGSTPIFGAEKHWQPAMASFAIAAAVGLVWIARRAAEVVAPRLRIVVVAAVLGIAVLAAAVETFHAQPYALSEYNALAGGAPGGADLGMNRQFWGYAARGVIPYLAAHAPAKGAPPAFVYTHDASPAWGAYQRGAQAGVRLPKSLPDAGMEGPGIAKSAWAFVVHERHFARHDFMIWESYGTVAPAFVLRAHGVPIVTLYKRP